MRRAPRFVVLPLIVADAMQIQSARFGGTSLMIVVGVALDTVNQIEAHLITRSYDGLSGGDGSGGRVPVCGRRDVLGKHQCDSSF